MKMFEFIREIALKGNFPEPTGNDPENFYTCTYYDKDYIIKLRTNKTTRGLSHSMCILRGEDEIVYLHCSTSSRLYTTHTLGTNTESGKPTYTIYTTPDLNLKNVLFIYGDDSEERISIDSQPNEEEAFQMSLLYPVDFEMLNDFYRTIGYFDDMQNQHCCICIYADDVMNDIEAPPGVFKL